MPMLQNYKCVYQNTKWMKARCPGNSYISLAKQ